MSRFSHLCLLTSLILIIFGCGGGGGGGSDGSTDPITPQSEPICIIEPAGDIILLAGQAIDFTAVVNDPDGLISAYQWDFGGGAPEEQVQNPTDVVFNTPGTYTVTLTPQDSDGQPLDGVDTATATILSPTPRGIDPTIGFMQNFLDKNSDGALDADVLTRLAAINDPPFIDVDANGGVQLVLTLNEDLSIAHEAELSALGVGIELRDTARRIQVRVPLNQINNLSSLSYIESVALPAYPDFGAGSIMTQGDEIMGSHILRNTYGLDGTGVKIGVISDGIGALADSQASGDLPDTIRSRSFRPDGNIAAGSEGTAMLEIIHDIAPGAELYFCNGGTAIGFAAAVEFMAGEDNPSTDEIEGFDLDIIIDDIGFFNVGPYDGTSFVSQAASNAVVVDEKRYFTISHNLAEAHYAFDFQDEDDNGFHEFNTSTIPGATAEDFAFAMGADSTLRVYIQWDDPEFDNADSDFHPFLYRHNESTNSFNQFCAGGIIDNDQFFVAVTVRAQRPDLPAWTSVPARTPNPCEEILITNKTNDPQLFSLRLFKMGGPDEVRNFTLFFVRGAALESHTPQGSVPNLGDAPNVISIGGVGWYAPEEKVSYSGYGPTKDDRQKPELMGPTAVCVTGAGGFGYDPSNFDEVACEGNVFIGTSAASPHAAAVAALLLQADPSLSHDDLKTILQDTADDILEPGVDSRSGWGRINAGNALEQVLQDLTLESINITNDDVTLTAAGATLQLNVEGRYSNGIEIDLTSAPSGTTYISSDTTVATVSAAGLVTAVADGTATITASNSGLSDTIRISISVSSPATLLSIDITDEDITLTQIGTTEQLMVTGHYSDGSSDDLSPATDGTTYSSSDTEVATVSADGLVTAVANGVANITATNGGFNDTAQVTVSVSTLITLESIVISNEDITLTQIGATEQLAVTGHYSDGSSDDLSPATDGTTYSSSDTGVATVSTNGLVTAVADGAATITATNSSLDDAIQVTIAQAPPGPSTMIRTVMSDSIDHGDLSRICWESENATMAVIGPDNINAIATGCMRVYPDETTTYIATAYGPGGTDTDSTTITVNPPGALSLEVMGQIGGYSYSVAVTEDYAYLGMGPSLQIIDKTNPAQPVARGKVLLQRLITAVAVSENHAYVIDTIGMHVINITDPAAPYVQGSVVGIENAGDVVVAGDHAYVAGGASGLIVIDVSDPANPVPANTYQYAASWTAHRLAISGSNVYVTGNTDNVPGLWIIDVSNPQTPDYVGSYETSVTSSWLYSVALSGDFAYIIAADDGVLVLDVSTPSEPTYAGSTDISGTANAIEVTNGRIYVSNSQNDLIIMTADPDTLTVEGTFETLDDAQDIAITGSYGFMACGAAGMQVIVLTSPSAPEALAWYQTSSSAGNMFAANPYCYTADMYSGLYVIDATDPGNPVHEGAYCDEETCSVSDVATSANYAYMAGGTDGLVVANVSNPLNMVIAPPVYYPAMGGAIGIDVYGDLAFLSTSGDDLLVYDISDPLAPVRTGRATTFGSDGRVSVTGNYAYVAKGYSGLSIVDASDPYTPVEALNMNTITCYDVEVYAGYAYVGAGSQGLLVYNLTSPTNPIQVGQYDQGSGTASNLAVSRGFAYMASDTDGLRVVDVNDPQNPTSSDIYKSGLPVKSVAVDGRYVYVSSEMYGVSVLRTNLKPADLVLPQDGNIRVRFVSKSASYDNEFHLLSPSSQMIFEAVAGNIGNTYELGSFAADDVLEFGLQTPSGHTFSTDHDTNFDECIHVIVTQITGNSWRLAWEDGNFAGDEDFNDVVVDIELY